MQNETITADNLRNLIGNEVRHQGQHCKIIEVLDDDGLSVILQCDSDHTTIQADQHGEAHRKVPSTFTLPVIDEESGELHEAFNELGVDHLL